MSTFVCPIIEVGPVGKHPNADTLSISHIYRYPCIIRTGDFKEGDRAVYIPEEALVPETPQFAFLWSNREGPPREKDRVVWAKKLRGIFSMGLLVPVPDDLKDLPTGTNVAVQMGIEKYEKPEPINTGGDNDPTPGWFHTYTDIENVRKYDRLLHFSEEVIITEKTHGANGRFCYREDKLYIGSHNNTKKDDQINIWSVVANRLGLHEKLKAAPDVIFYGEVYGQVQKGFDYGITKGQSDLVLFDAYDLNTGRYLNGDEFLELAQRVGLKTVPILYRGPWQGLDQCEPLADGPNGFNGKHMREGFVVKPMVERWNEEIGRVVLKLHGQEYLLGKHKG